MNVLEMVQKRDEEIFNEYQTYKFTDTADFVHESIGKKFNLAPVTVKNILKKIRKQKRLNDL